MIQGISVLDKVNVKVTKNDIEACHRLSESRKTIMRLVNQKYPFKALKNCHLITSSKTPVGIEVANMTIMSEEKVKLFGIHIDKRLNFDYHISQLSKKTGKKLQALT